MGRVGVRMGTVWDRTVDVLQGRTGILASLAVVYILVPGIVSGALAAYATPDSGMASLARFVAFLVGILLLAGMLALTAVASDPAVDRGAAHAIAWRRLPPALGLLLLLGLAVAIVLIPAMIVLFQSGATFDRLTGKFDMSRANPSMAGIAGLLSLVFVVVGLWLSAKIAPLFGVIVNERLGLGALRRSFRLTHGATLRLIGVLILYAIVSVVLAWAVTMVIGVVARLILGSDAAATVALIVAIANALVTCVVTVVQMVFYAQYYVAARDATEAHEVLQ